MPFIESQLEHLRPLWDRMLAHRFLLRTRDGTLPDEDFARWMRQDYLFVEAAVPFISGLLAKAPPEHREGLAGFLPALQTELELFQERAAEAGVDLGGAPPSFTCHAYVQFLLATAYRHSYAEAFTVLYVAEKAYHESWKVVEAGLDPRSPWMPFVRNWASDDFGAWVTWLEERLEELAGDAGPAERERMAHLFELTTRYEIAFWEMALTAESWPGLEDERPDGRLVGAVEQADGDPGMGDASARPVDPGDGDAPSGAGTTGARNPPAGAGTTGGGDAPSGPGTTGAGEESR